MTPPVWLMVLVLLGLACACGESPETSAAESTRPDRSRRSTQPIDQPPGAGTGSVTFGLDMPEGARAHVELTRTLRRGPRTDLRGRATWELTVTHEGGTLLESENLALDVEPERSSQDYANAALVLGSYFPSVRVDQQGSLEGLLTPSRSLEQLRSATDVLPGALQNHAAFRMVSAAWADEHVLLRSARGVWRSLILPQGEPFDLNQDRGVESTSTLGVGGQEIPQTSTFRVVGSTPCFEGDGPDACVWVEMRNAPDEAALAEFAQSMGLNSFRFEQRGSLVTEPGTLLPHRQSLRTERWSTVEADGRPVTIHEIEERTLVFRWRLDTIRDAGS